MPDDLERADVTFTGPLLVPDESIALMRKATYELLQRTNSPVLQRNDLLRFDETGEIVRVIKTNWPSIHVERACCGTTPAIIDMSVVDALVIGTAFEDVKI